MPCNGCPEQRILRAQGSVHFAQLGQLQCRSGKRVDAGVPRLRCKAVSTSLAWPAAGCRGGCL